MFEFHFFKIDDVLKMYRINKYLKDQGFITLRQPKENTFSKVCFGIYNR